jgi:hypothetical protein
MEIARREFLAGTAGVIAAMVTGGCAEMTRTPPLSTFAYVGCYTSQQRRGHGEGITVHRIDAASGAWTQLQLVKTAADNPSWLTFDRTQRFLYAAHGDGDVVTAFRVVWPTQCSGAGWKSSSRRGILVIRSKRPGRMSPLPESCYGVVSSPTVHGPFTGHSQRHSLRAGTDPVRRCVRNFPAPVGAPTGIMLPLAVGFGTLHAAQPLASHLFPTAACG